MKIIAIDPDAEKNGVALLDPKTREIELFTLTFPRLIDFLVAKRDIFGTSLERYKVVIEAGWLNKSNWHVYARDTPQLAAAKGNATGRNHETGRKIAEMCEHYGIVYELVKPLRKNWRGYDGKITHDELANFTHLRDRRTNQEERDAALLAWVTAGLPIRVGH